MIIAPYLGFLIDWISMSDCSYGDMPVIGLINIWFPVERLPPQPPPTTITTTSPALFSSLSFCLWHRSERMGSRHIEYQVADWGCHSGPQWSLVARCACPLVSTAGFVSRVCEGFVGADRRRGGGCRAECCPLTRACHSRCLFLYSSLSVDCWGRCLMTIPSLRWHLSCHMFHLKWIPCNTCLWLTFSNELSRDDTANIGSVCHGDRGPSHMFSSQRSARVDECI